MGPMSESRADVEILRLIAGGDVRALGALHEALAADGIELEPRALGEGKGA